MSKPSLFLDDEALNQIQEDMVKRDAEYRANRAADEADQRKQLWTVSIVSAFVGSLVAAIVAILLEHFVFG